MQNLFEDIRDSLVFNKFVIDDLICVEYNCPVKDEHLGIYAQSDYIIHILSGKKTWKTLEGEWVMTPGESIYVKKGAAIVTQHFDEEFCMLGFFLPDDIIRDSLADVLSKLSFDMSLEVHQFTASKLTSRSYLDRFFQSMLPYFNDRTEPPEAILKLKLQELLINLIYHCEDDLLVSYLKTVAINSEPSLTHIMETNFSFNLKLEQYAKLCHRSLSKFKKDFFNHYNCTPGKWLLNRRLEFSANLISRNSSNITQIAFESGFEDVSHFSRVFKDKFSVSPSQYAKK